MNRTLLGALAASVLLLAPTAGLASAATPTSDPPFFCIGSTKNNCPAKAPDKPAKVEPAKKSAPDKCDTPEWRKPPTADFPYPFPDVTSPLPGLGHAVCEIQRNAPK